MKRKPRPEQPCEVIVQLVGRVRGNIFRSGNKTSFRYGISMAVCAVLALSVLTASSASATTPGARPTAPRHVTAVAGDNSAIVNFLAPSSNGGSRIADYYIEVYPKGSAIRRCKSMRCTISGLSNGVAYHFTVAAVNKVGASRYSAPSNSVTPEGPVGITSTVTFNANGGSGTMASETEVDGTTAALTLNSFTYTGYTFNSWNTAANGSGTNFTNDDLVKFDGSVTLYAQWTVDSSTIIFNANGGSGAMASETEVDGTTAALTLNSFTYTGYTFNSWNTAANGSGTSYVNGALYSFTTSITLYAQWSAVFLGTHSQNWSGYVLPSNTILTQATAEWVVPHLNCVDTPNAQAGIWVGIGGATWATGGTSGQLFQTGTANNCVNGAQKESAWFELFPYMSTYSLIFSDFPITAGDTIFGKVGINTEGQWVAVLEDLTTGIQGVYEVGVGWDVSTIATNSLIVPLQQYGGGWSYSGGYSAEWIVEPGTSFANYGSEAFTNLGTSVPSWSLTASDAQEIVQNGVILSVPGAVSGDGFTVTYTGP
jgi:uncharacterized repeat protein (TIGR02543 family)